MIQTNFLQDLIQYYNQIDFKNYQFLSKIDDNLVWYFSDYYKKDVYMNLDDQPNFAVIDLDIKTAGPTICRNFYGDNSKFVQKLLTIEDKKQRSIFISTNLDSNDLKCINIVCKMVILGLVIELNRIIKSHSKNDVFILELKKDGILFCCDKIVLSVLDDLQDYCDTSPFINFIYNHYFNFHYDIYKYYCRYNRTTILVNEAGEIIRKGQFKYYPPAIGEISKQLFQTGGYNRKLQEKYVNQKFIYTILKSNCKTFLDKYILCNNKKALCNSFQYNSLTPAIIDDISGLTYLTCLFSPLLKLYYRL